MDDKTFIILIFIFFNLGFFLLHTLKSPNRETFYLRAIILHVVTIILICYGFYLHEKQTDISTPNTVAAEVNIEQQKK